MATATEAATAATPMGAALQAGVEALSLNQTVSFTRYIKLVLPLDGFVFWVRADLVSKAALFNTEPFNSIPFNLRTTINPATPLVFKGSVHVVTAQHQDENSNSPVNRMIFTSESEIQDFNLVGPTSILIGSFNGMRFAFSQRNSFYQQANLFHYAGDAIYPAMESQIIDSLAGFNARDVVVSNSLPLWLSFSHYVPPYKTVTSNLLLYPSFVLPDNLVPPYGAVHIPPESTQAIQGAPTLDPTFTHNQLVTERVRVTTYGLRNADALSFQDAISQYSLDYGYFGIMNMPVFRDEKRPQVELSMLAMKKTIEFEINYYQYTMRNIARQLILSCIPSFELSPNFTP